MLANMIPQWIIEKKRDGQPLTREEIEYFILGYTQGEIPDYQMAAMAMAIYFKGMTPEETVNLTDIMLHSGDLVDTSSIEIPKVDKHSTGGVGDKVSLLLAPLVACCDLAVPMISGRGLGITGGTLDKLESIPGYRTDLSDKEFVHVLQTCGCSITGQTGQLAPADKKLYALRDVTATVPSIPLITASIMAKKLAEGIDALVLDCKWGKGAFMRTYEDSQELARTIVDVGARMGKNTASLITDMNQPLGQTAGNALEVIETVQALSGDGPDDLMEVTLSLCAQMLILAGKAEHHADAVRILNRHIESGAALERFKQMVECHGGDPKTLDDVSRLPSAEIKKPYPAPQSGYLSEVDAESIGKACVVLGAGRSRTEDTVDFAVGVSGLLKIGDKVGQDQPLLTLHANDEKRLEEATRLVAEAFTFSQEPVKPPALIKDTVLPQKA